MARELRTPLNAIIGFSEVLLDPSLKDAAEEEQARVPDGCVEQWQSMSSALSMKTLTWRRLKPEKWSSGMKLALLQDVV